MDWKTKSGVFVRSGWGEGVESAEEFLQPHGVSLEAALGAPLGPSGRGNHFLAKEFHKGHDQESDWPDIMNWMHKTASEYLNATMKILKK